MQRIQIDVNLLYPPYRRQLLACLDDLVDDGYDFRLTSGFRGEHEQNALFAQGRTAPGPKVTNAKYGDSYHNFGIAGDLTAFTGSKADWRDASYDIIGKYAKNHGLTWGGDFKSLKDRPHLEYNLASYGLTLADLRKIYAADGLPGVWRLLDAAAKG